MSLAVGIFTGIIAIAALVFGSEKLVERAIKVAEYLRISPAFIGLTVLSIGTSIPETVTHIVGSINILLGNLDPQVASATVVGTNIGSDIVQQTLIVGVVALIGTVVASKKFLRRDYYVMIGAAVLVWLFAIGGKINRVEGFLLVLLYSVYLWFVFIDEKKKHNKTKPDVHVEKRNLYLDALYMCGFLIIVVFSAEHILDVSQEVVSYLQVGGSLIGIMVVGFCTALPEFTTAVIGVLKKNGSLSIGTLVGSNITNPMMALGIGALISGYSVPSVVILYDLPIKIVSSIILLYFLWKGTYKGRLGVSKKEAVTMIVIYVFYLWIRTQFFPNDVF